MSTLEGCESSPPDDRVLIQDTPLKHSSKCLGGIFYIKAKILRQIDENICIIRYGKDEKRIWLRCPESSHFYSQIRTIFNPHRRMTCHKHQVQLPPMDPVRNQPFNLQWRTRQGTLSQGSHWHCSRNSAPSSMTSLGTQ